MDEKLYLRLCEDIAADRGELVKTIIRLVNIKSVHSDPEPGAPFGAGARRVLDTVAEMGREAGFVTKMYDDVFVSLAMQEGPIDLGIWCHGDVVPEGNDWLYEPYNAVEYKDCVIGRGATDNKGQLSAVFHLMKLLQAREVAFPFNIALFVGSNEEDGMEDIKRYLAEYPQPKLNLVPDGGFPVSHNGGGGFRMWLETEDVQGIAIDGGHADAPGVVTATLPDGTVLTEAEAPAHNAKVKTDNMFGRLLDRLPKSPALDYLNEIAHAVDASVFGITYRDEEFGATIVRIREIKTENGKLSAYVNLRYPYGITDAQLREATAKSAAEHGFCITKIISTVPPFKYALDNPYLKLLWDTAEEVIGNGKKPFVERGGTYAHWLRNGFIYGMNGNLKPEDYPEGRGGAHGRDEVVSISRLQRAMRIYARLLLKLKEQGI